MDPISPAALAALYLATIDQKELLARCRALIEPGDTEEDITRLIAEAIDAAIPEELFGLDQKMEPVWQAAAERIVRWVRVSLTPARKVVRGKLHPRMREELARVQKLLATATENIGAATVVPA